MARHAIDLSQPLSRESQLHPFFAPTQIIRPIQHTDAAEGDPSFAAELISTSNHAATHVDAFAHYDRSPDAPLIADMPLDTFWGPALCVDIREYERGHDITAAEVERAVEASGQELQPHDILVFCSDHYNRTAGTPAFLDGFAGISAEAVHWMADRQVKIFGVETISPDLVYLTDRYPTHRACAERGVTHYENLNNLKDVVNQRFEFFGFPLRLVPAAGSPVRAVGIVDS
jgi:kynurenine formamidase